MTSSDNGGQQRATRRTDDTEEVTAESTEELKDRHEKLSDDVDSVLDEIDEVLESNAEDFVKGFVQKGGE